MPGTSACVMWKPATLLTRENLLVEPVGWQWEAVFCWYLGVPRTYTCGWEWSILSKSLPEV
jgi:hypothetical protein